MEGFVDIHLHVLPDVDDGPADVAEAVRIASGLRALGFTCLVATPHARAGLYDPSVEQVGAGLAAIRAALGPAGPRVLVAGEHFLDDVTWMRIAEGEARPYPSGRAILVEIPAVGPAPLRLVDQLFRLRVGGLRPVLAHPERCAAVQTDRGFAEDLRRAGVALALDLTSLVGAAGRTARRTAQELLELDLIDVACSDIHASDELRDVDRAIGRLRKLCGDAALDRLLHAAPVEIALGEDPAEDRGWS